MKIVTNMPEKNTNKINKEEIAIRVQNVSKTFRIPYLFGRQAHEKITSLRGAAISGLSSIHLPFSRGGKGGVSYEEFKALDNVYLNATVLGMTKKQAKI